MSDDRLTLSQMALLVAYAVGMSGGQLLFKMAALRYAEHAGGPAERILGLLLNLYFLAALRTLRTITESNEFVRSSAFRRFFL
jgi:hypothetical protein